MKMDMHLHTDFSDGANTPLEMTLKAIELGYEAIAFTDHVWKSSEWLDKYIQAIGDLKRQFSRVIQIFCAVEAKVVDLSGNIDFNDVYYERLDFVLAAMHKIPTGGNVYAGRSDLAANPAFYREKWFLALKNALNNPLVDGFAHPFNIYSAGEWDGRMRKKFVEMLSESGKFTEYNVKYSPEPIGDFWANHNLRFVFSSDSHSIKDLTERSAMIDAASAIYKDNNPFSLRAAQSAM